jgi:hypothetical protein
MLLILTITPGRAPVREGAIMRMPNPVAIHELSRACRLSPSFMLVASGQRNFKAPRLQIILSIPSSSVAEMYDAAFAATGALEVTSGVSIPANG